MHLIISFLCGLQFKILFACILPLCLSPILIIGILKDGASKIPLEEFPIMPEEYFNNDKYFFCPKDLK